MGLSNPSCFIDYIIKNGDYIQLYTTTKNNH